MKSGIFLQQGVDGFWLICPTEQSACGGSQNCFERVSVWSLAWEDKLLARMSKTRCAVIAMAPASFDGAGFRDGVRLGVPFAAGSFAGVCCDRCHWRSVSRHIRRAPIDEGLSRSRRQPHVRQRKRRMPQTESVGHWVCWRRRRGTSETLLIAWPMQFVPCSRTEHAEIKS